MTAGRFFRIEGDMDRQQAAAAFGIDPDDLPPIEVCLDALANEVELPVVAIAMCCARAEEATPALLAALEDAAKEQPPTAEASRFFFRAIHILGGLREQRAFKPLLRFLAADPEVVEDELGDATADTLTRIVAGVFDGDHRALFAAVRDFELDEYVRGSLLGSVAFLTWTGAIAREETVRFLEEFARNGPALGDHGWYAWLEAIELLGIEQLAPEVRRVWHADDLLQSFVDLPDFEAGLSHAITDPQDPERFRRAHLGYIEDVIVALEPFREATEDEANYRYDLDDGFAPAVRYGEPIINPFRDVGRNDPCPCGSGKKYKKCCLP
jgi:hypothetical protein